jgi:hypothetical protein
MSVTDFENAETERGRSWPLPSVLGAPATAAVVVDSALSDFAQDHPEFRVERTDRSVRLIRRDTPTEVLQTLTRQGVVPERDQVSISAALVEVVGSLIRQHAISGALGSGVMPGPACPLGAPIRVSAGHVTPLDALDNLVSQVPGLSWFVLYDPERAQDPVDIGLWCQDGDTFRTQLPR